MVPTSATPVIKGVFPICPTPFLDNGDLDIETFERLVDFYVECGVHGLIVLGIFGEAAMLTADEGMTILGCTVARTAGRIPVILGTGNLTLRDLASLSRQAMEEGAAGLMVAPPRGARTDEQIHTAVARQMKAIGPDVPVFFQDYPPFNDVYMSVPLMLTLAREYPQIISLKVEDNPVLGKISRLKQGLAEWRGPTPTLMVANSGIYAGPALRRGADGLATGFSYPEVLVGMHSMAAKGDFEGATDLFDAHLPMICQEVQPGLGIRVRKHVLWRRGLLRTPKIRQTAPKLDATDIEEIDWLIARGERRMQALAWEKTASGRWTPTA
ncbi:MAG: dihydrodipicolinate synthase family protein [Rhodospirillales bacterium]|nr:dihydrodipicolinate synthase family protein [Rhodospirillales bacterium]